MKKLMIVLVIFATTAAANAQLVQNYDFTAGDVSWTHVGPWGSGMYNDGTDWIWYGGGWGDGVSTSNSSIKQNTGVAFLADTKYALTVIWRDPAVGGLDIDNILIHVYDATSPAIVASGLFGPLSTIDRWTTATIAFDTATNPSVVGHDIGVGVKLTSPTACWVHVNSISLVIASAAHTPAPQDGATVDPVLTEQLSWTYPPTPVGTYTSKVYLGSPNISSATQLSDTNNTDNVVSASLSSGTTYQWRVDVTDSGTGSTITGPVWTFYTALSPVDNDITIDPDVTYQTFEGFGVGTMDQFVPYWYSVWSTAKLNEYLDKMYTLDNNGLGLEITRVPMPVGDDLTHDHMGAYVYSGYRSPEAFEPTDGTFDWTGHEDILWHIQGAAARDVKMWAYWHGVPLWLTVSGCTAGHTNGWENNLQAGKEWRFADHMCDVIEHFRDSWGVDFDYIGAINEPDETWWEYGGNQPGCHVSSSQAVTIYQELKNEMDSRGLTQKLVAPDSFSSQDDHNLTYLDVIRNSSVGSYIDVYACHQYSVTDYGMSQWYWRASKYDKSFWMSEWGDWENDGWPDNNPQLQAENYANKIQQGLKDMKATGYVFWESDFFLDTSASNFTLRKSYWVAAQFTRFIRSGMKLIQTYDSNANCKTTVWIDPTDDPTGQKLVMVTVNDSTAPTTANYDLSQFRGVKINELRRTSPTEDFVSLPITQASEFDFSVYAPSKSVVTVSATIQNCKDMLGDLTDDCLVNIDDLRVVAGNWLDSPALPCSPLTGDTDDDCSVNLIDHANINTDWLAIKAFYPDPYNAQTGVANKGTFFWGDNYHAASYDVYIGTNSNDVQNATDSSSEYQGNTTEASYLYDLNINQTYYWRIDSEDSLGVFRTGDVWSFTTASVSADADLVGWWKLDETSGYAQDSSPSSNPGYLFDDANWQPSQGKINGAVDLDGNGDYVSVPGFELASNNVTITAWINGWKTADWAGIVYSRSSSEAVGLHFGGDNKLHYSWNYDDSATWNWSGGPTIPQNEWALIAMVIEPDKATLYVKSDAGLETKVNTMTHAPQMIDDLKFGYDDVGGSRYFNGLIDDVRIYKRALTSQEIMDMVQ